MQTGRQQGFSFIGLVLGIAAFLFVAVLAMKMIPAYLNNAKIERVFKAIASDVELKDASEREVREAFKKRTTIEPVTEVTADSFEVARENGALVLRADYTVQIPVAGNVSLLLDFHPSSAR